MPWHDEDEEHDRRREEGMAFPGQYPTRQDLEDELWMMIHECHGKAHREFIYEDHYEYWTWCEVCGNWWLNAAVNLRCLEKLEIVK